MIDLQVKKRLIGSEGPFDLNVNLSVSKGELAVLYGASGAGKTTMLRMLAGLDHPDGGIIRVDGETWFSSQEKVCVPPRKRSVGFVFQSYALFPTMTVRRNLEFAASSRKDPQVDMLLEMVELQELQHRYPDRLSGGQQQRVALARALIREPKILLLDEPLSALDGKMREKLQEEILSLHHGLGLTTLLVSHDQWEISRLADRVFVLREGRVVFDGPPYEAFRSERAGAHCPLKGEIVEITDQNGFLAIVAAANGDSLRVEIRLNKRQLQHLVRKSPTPRFAPPSL